MKNFFRILLLFLSSIFIPTILSAQQQIIVDQDGNGDFTTIQEALDQVNHTSLSSDMEILIEPGEYDEELRIENIDNSSALYSITLRSANSAAEDVILTNSSTTTLNERTLFVDSVHYFSMEYLTFKRSSDAYSEAFISLSNNSSNITIAHNTFLNESTNATYAIFDNYDFLSEGDTLENLQISNNRFAEVIAFSNYFQIFKNITFSRF